MSMVREFFLAEADNYLDQLVAALDAAGAHGADAGAILRVARGLRGSARMAQVEGVLEAADLLERAGRALAADRLAWEPDTARRFRDTAHDVRRMLRLDEGSEPHERVLEALRDRWRAVGVDADEAAPAPGDATDPESFRRYVGGELGGIVATLDAALAAFDADPEDRAHLGEIARVQRAVLGSARLDEIPLIAETLRALDELTGMVARLEVPVVHEWADIFRSARAVLASAAPALRQGDEPVAFRPGLAKLRTLRAELGDRFPPPERRAPDLPQLEGADPGGAGPGHPRASHEGAAPSESGEAASTAGVDGGGQSDGPDASAAADPDGIVPIESLLYRGERAVERAEALRATLERALGGDPQGGAALAELYDLIRLAAR